PTVSLPEEAALEPSLAEGGVARRGDTEERSREAASTAIVAPEATPTVAAEPTVADEPGVQTMVHAADAGSVDVAMLRRGWPSLMEHLQSTRQMILKASLES